LDKNRTVFFIVIYVNNFTTYPYELFMTIIMRNTFKVI